MISQLSSTLQEVDAASLWPQAGSEDGGPRPETVTVTLTQNPGGNYIHELNLSMMVYYIEIFLVLPSYLLTFCDIYFNLFDRG